MAQNRLRLDFSLTTREERKDFLANYLTNEIFTRVPPTDDELEKMADYLLWGKDKEGKNGKQQGLDLRTKHRTWDDSPVDSLDQLIEQPTFSEAQIAPLGTTRFCTKKKIFSREEALREAPPIVRDSLLSLFAEIDRTDLMCEEYDLLHGKRTKPIRSELLNKFSEEELCTLREKVLHWNQYHYLKKRHQLVEMRREQYTLRDAYRKVIFSQDDDAYHEPVILDWDAGIEVLPLGLKQDGELSHLLFRKWSELNPTTMPQSLLPNISALYWQKKQFAPSTSQQWIDFRELEHVYSLLNTWVELEELLPELDPLSNMAQLLRTLAFYVEQADLTEVQREILQLKLHKVRNVDIAEQINHKYNKTYTSNYISTIFRQRIIPKINDAAAYHEKIVGNIFFEEEFKQCSACGEIKLRDSNNFTRKSRSSDGFSSRCKKCEKKARQGG